MPKIILENITKRYGNFYAVDNLNMEIDDGSFITLLGPSGCGKTTTLRMIAGLETPTKGKITIGDTVVFDSEKSIDVPPNKRDVGFLFQNYALWPNMTVYENISFGLVNKKKYSKTEIDEIVQKVSKIVKIEMFLDRYPAELSGGQQQRVAIARTLAPEPKVIFMDEPLSNLDAKLRLEMRTELQRLHLTSGCTFVYVTHDQMEAMTLASKICLMENGLLKQYDKPLTVYEKPNDIFVADFVGNPSINFINCDMLNNRGNNIDFRIFENIDVSFKLDSDNTLDVIEQTNKDKLNKKKAHFEKISSQKDYVEKSNKDKLFKYNINLVDEKQYTEKKYSYVIGLRPENIEVVENGMFEGTIYSSMPTGMETTLRISVGNYILTSVVFGEKTYNLDEKIRFNITGNKVKLFLCETGQFISNGSITLL